MTDNVKIQVCDFVRQHIQENGSVSGLDLSADTNFVDSRILDSFAILTMILDIESEFSIKFDQAALASDEIKTIGGLADIVVQRSKEIEATDV